MLTLILKAEQRRIVSDAFLILMVCLTPLVALLLRIYWPTIDAAFPQWQISQYKPVMSIFIALLTPMMMGLILGFNLLGDREQGMLTVVRTTPAGLPRYLAARSSGYLLVSVLLTPLLHGLLGFVELPLYYLLIISVCVQTLLPLSALLLLNFAKNLVEGFAIMKGTGGLITIPVIFAMFVPDPWFWLASPLPTWWTLWGYFEIAAGSAGAIGWLLLGCVLQLAICVWLWRRLMQRLD